NSIDAIEGRGTLTFETAAEHGDVVIRVRDTGNGIPDHARDHIFEPFFSTKEQGRGTGLGLFVSKQVVESMGGQLELKESGPQGTVFLVRIATGNEDETTGSSSALT
ncbi:MAG: HAMP domain-containing histidine kinase, partial [Deltaproteobacteria bacterium]|nr:HAMP domain-containing histidine kinase [Deltaproteobacteria bacterium]